TEDELRDIIHDTLEKLFTPKQLKQAIILCNISGTIRDTHEFYCKTIDAQSNIELEGEDKRQYEYFKQFPVVMNKVIRSILNDNKMKKFNISPWCYNFEQPANIESMSYFL